MKFDIVAYEPKYDLRLGVWQQDHGQLPSQTASEGAVAVLNHLPVAMGFLHKPNSSWSLLEGLIASPSSDKLVIEGAFRSLMAFFEKDRQEVLLRPFCSELDYPYIEAFWKARDVVPTPLFMLPPTGYTAVHKGIPFAAGFLTHTDAGYAVVGNLVTDKDASGPNRSLALDCLLTALKAKAVSRGVGIVSCSTIKESLGARYEKHGFQKDQTGLSIYVGEF